jgi:hypothetical protein
MNSEGNTLPKMMVYRENSSGVGQKFAGLRQAFNLEYVISIYTRDECNASTTTFAAQLTGTQQMYIKMALFDYCC